MYSCGELDAVYVGKDYAFEHLAQWGSFAETNVYTVRFILATASVYRTMPLELPVYTKFGTVAAARLPTVLGRQVDIREVSGATEMYAASGRGMAFDVECTGISIEKNMLQVWWRSEDMHPGWISRDAGTLMLQEAGIPNAELIRTLGKYCNDYIHRRDAVTAERVFAI